MRNSISIREGGEKTHVWQYLYKTKKNSHSKDHINETHMGKKEKKRMYTNVHTYEYFIALCTMHIVRAFIIQNIKEKIVTIVLFFYVVYDIVLKIK